MVSNILFFFFFYDESSEFLTVQNFKTLREEFESSCSRRKLCEPATAERDAQSAEQHNIMFDSI